MYFFALSAFLADALGVYFFNKFNRIGKISRWYKDTPPAELFFN